MSNDDILWKNIETLKKQEVQKGAPASHKAREVGRNRGTTMPRRQDTTIDNSVSRHRDAMTPRYPNPITPTLVDAIRKAVRQTPKEAGTHRLTQEEKREIAAIVYTYSTQGYRTSENEIARIAINWLIRDYQENGRDSVLTKVIDALNG